MAWVSCLACKAEARHMYFFSVVVDGVGSCDVNLHRIFKFLHLAHFLKNNKG